KIIENAKETLDKSILDIITKFGYKEVDGYYVINVYVKEETKAKQLGKILTNIENYAKECGVGVLVDFLRG
ncbi:MAG: hypothetical protein Q4B63_11275, partial [Clostridium perfringens]|nr:hypothetical protein [Clostridium perfringens]